jgi:hypothetical protein
MVRRRTPETTATNANLDKEAIMAEIEASIRKKVKIYLTKQKRGIKYSSYNNKQETEEK